MTEELEEYHRKRHFDTTEEPEGTVANDSDKRLRFVVQHHIANRDHYDFRLELDGVLKSWAVPKGPSFSTRDKRLAVRVEDHPFDYRSFEGTIPKGEYGGGTVMVWDEGYWEPLVDPHEGLENGDLKFNLHGTRLKGRWVLVHMKPRPGEKDVNWLLIKEKDEYVDSADISSFTTSVTSGRTMTEIAEGQPAEKDKEVTITHADKIMYPGTTMTKGDIASYYRNVSKRMLPYLEKRLVSSVRCPEGIGESCFFRKHPANNSAGIGTLRLPNDKGSSDEYFYLKNLAGIMSEVQMNTLEFHLWGSHIDTLEHPDMMVFDLDPDVGMELEQVRQGVRDVKSLLDDLSLTSFLKTSGGKGYHIVLPFKPTGSWDAFKAFAHNIAKLMEAQWPDRYTANSRKSARAGRIYVDWQRNIRGATSVAPYSLRSKNGVTVSMPILWSELDHVAPNQITEQVALNRLQLKDPWGKYFETDQELKVN